ncbi:NTP transferase domain-containing protein [Candidatus Daviesbacteria bacterium]|nr:NTP transferase domain-containing protein [Candidatus Daviesbacteria bacterium]
MDKPSLIILAAGKGTRLQPLTNTTPKPLIKIAGKLILEWNMENAYRYISEIVMVVGHLESLIRDYFGKSYKGVPIKYVTQKKLNGNAVALGLVKDVIGGSRLVIINGDDIYSKELFQKSFLGKDFLICRRQEDCSSVGAVKSNNGRLTEIVEKPKKFISNLANTGFYFVGSKIFQYCPKIKLSKRGEFEVTDLINLYAKDRFIKIIRNDMGSIPISYPWQILEATQKLFSGMKKSLILGKVEKGVTIKGKIFLGKGSIIKSGAYLEGNFYIGENCVIGPNCYLKGFAALGNNCFVGNGSEVVRSSLGNDVSLRHQSYVGDSIIGNTTNFGAGSKVANLRHDFKNIKMMINNELTDTGRNKFGAVIGDGVKLGINTSVYPGVKIGSFKTTLPNEIVKKDLV